MTGQWDIDLPWGEEAEHRCRDLLLPIRDGRLLVEVKHPRRADGRFFVEVAHDPGGRGQWVPSGLMITRAHLWAFLKGGVWVLVDVRRLERLYCVYQSRLIAGDPNGSCPTRGFLVPDFDTLASDRFTP